MIELLPKWKLNNTSPAFDDMESATVLEMVAKLHSKMNELISSNNTFVDNVNKLVDDFKASTIKDLEVFEVALRQEFQDFIDVINLKMMEVDKLQSDYMDEVNARLTMQDNKLDKAISDQNKEIDESITYVKDNIETVASEIVTDKVANGEISVNMVYDATNEDLSLKLVSGASIVEEVEANE